MNQHINNSAKTFFVEGSKSRNRLLRTGFAFLALLCMTFLSTSARAACARFGGVNSTNAVRLPMIAAGGQLSGSFGESQSIVGLWHVIYTNSADQSMFNDSFDLWHSDGTEFESAFLAPAGGNLCVGVWKQSGFRSVTLHHIGWLFNSQNLTATATNTFTVDETVTLSSDGNGYNGKFTFKIWNLDGSFTGSQVNGTIAATRIKVE